MSILNCLCQIKFLELFIPMRDYETGKPSLEFVLSVVIHPHEGL